MVLSLPQLKYAFHSYDRKKLWDVTTFYMPQQIGKHFLVLTTFDPGLFHMKNIGPISRQVRILVVIRYLVVKEKIPVEIFNGFKTFYGGRPLDT